MTVVASAWPAGTDHGQPSGLFPADCRWDRRVALLDSETAALLALGPVRLRRNGAVGIPRRTALHWRALTRLTEPLDAAVAGLHHGDDVRFRRAGRQAVAIVLQRNASDRPGIVVVLSALCSIPKASIPLRGRFNVRQVVLTENLRNEFVVHNLLHHISHEFGAGNSALLCGLLQILTFQWNDDILDGHNMSPRGIAPSL